MTFNAYLKSLRVLQLTLFAGYLLSIIISIALFKIEIVPLLPESQNSFLVDIVVIALTFAGIISSFYLFQVLLLRQGESYSLARKLSAFKTAYFLRLAIIEGLGIIAIVFFMVSLSPVALTASILIAIILGLLKPSKREMIRVLRLNPGQEAQIMAKRPVINDLRQEVFKNRLN